MIATLPKTYYNKNHEKQHSKEKLMKKLKKSEISNQICEHRIKKF